MELKACPFCGKKPVIEKGFTDVDDCGNREICVPYRIICNDCGYYMSKDAKFAATNDGKVVMVENGYMELLTKWNRRSKE